MQGFKRFIFTVLVAVASTMVTPTAQAASAQAPRPRITMVDLGNLGRPWTYTTAMNDAGEVVGLGDAGDGWVHLFRWRRGVMTDLGVKGMFGVTTASGIDERGRVIGSYAISGEPTGFLWQDGTLTTLPFTPRVINNHLQIAGVGYGRAFLWDNGDLIDITPPDSGSAFVMGINEQGQVILDVSMPTPAPDPGAVQRVMVWQSGRLTDLGDLGGGNTYAADINDRGEITGWSDTADGVSHGYLWRDGVMRRLDSLDARSEPAAINNRGQVVGRLSAPDFIQRPVVWDRGGITDLGTDGRSGGANLLSENGDVAGIDVIPDDVVFRPFLWRRNTLTELPRPPGTTTSNLTSISHSGSKLAGSIFLEDRWQAVLWLIP